MIGGPVARLCLMHALGKVSPLVTVELLKSLPPMSIERVALTRMLWLSSKVLAAQVGIAWLLSVYDLSNEADGAGQHTVIIVNETQVAHEV